MPNYLVKWEMDADTDTPLDAAKAAWASMRRKGSIANVFQVIDKETGEIVDVDLEAERGRPVSAVDAALGFRTDGKGGRRV